MKTEKDLTVETLRGAVIILVVIGHVIGSGSDGGMRVADDSVLRHFYYTFAEFLQMPLFTFIAGWVYALRPVSREKVGNFINKKFIRIFIPMIVVGISYFMLQYLIPGTNKKGDLSEIWKIFFFPYTLFWYLYSLFLVFLLIALIDSFKIMEKFIQWTAIFSIALSLLIIRDRIIPFEYPNFLSYKGAVYLLPCFILGVGMKRFSDYFQNRTFIIIVITTLITGIIIQQLSWFKIINYTLDKDTGVGLLIGLTGTIVLFRLHLKANWLIWFGSFAYSIFLFHAFGTAGGRIIIQKLGINSTPIVFTVSLIAGIFLPILAEKILKQFKLTRLLFLGQT